MTKLNSVDEGKLIMLLQSKLPEDLDDDQVEEICQTVENMNLEQIIVDYLVKEWRL